MGGSDSTTIQKHYVTEYKTDPAVIQLMQSSQNQIDKLSQLILMLHKSYQQALIQGKKLKDPAKYQELKQKAFQAFVGNLQKIKWTDPMKRKDGHKYNVLIGNISSGKTSMINMACNLDLEVGLGECTMQAAQVATSKDGKVHIWDCPGQNQDFSVFEPQALSYFATADRIFVLYPDSIKSCKQIATVMAKINPNGTYMIRTQCDKWNTKCKKTIEQQVQTDKKYLQNKIKANLPVLATSAISSKNYKDNQKFIDLITS